MTDTAIAIVHADPAFIAVDKPSGLLAVRGRGPHKQDCAHVRVQARYADALVVHRLDQATSGLLLFALGRASQRQLSSAFERRAVDKRYVAIVAGRIADDEGSIELPLTADWPNRPRQMVDLHAGRAALTRWRVLQRGDDCTRVELRPLTGRSHQLRVHLAAIGHPIVGDALYAPETVREGSPRLLLHASSLSFEHPVGNQPVQLASAPPF